MTPPTTQNRDDADANQPRTDTRPPHAPRADAVRPQRPVAAATRPTPIEVDPAYGGDTHELVTPRLRLRPLLASDRDAFVDALRAARDELEVAMPLHEPGWTDDDVFEHQLDWALEGLRDATAVRRAVLDVDAGRFLGMGNLIKIERGLTCRAEITLWLRPDVSGRGLGTEALGAIVDDTFDDLPRGQGLHQIGGWMREEHPASERMLRKLGFDLAGDPPQAIHAGGRWYTHRFWLLTVDRWAARQHASRASAVTP